LHTVFAPLTIARKLAGEQLDHDLRDHPNAVMGALDAITETVIRYVAEVGKAGADGIFYASQTASRDVMAEGDHSRFGMPYSWRVLESLDGSPMWTMLHVHGRQIYFDRSATLPVAAMNWHDRLTAPSLGDGLRRFKGAVVGGLNESQTLRTGSPAAAAADVADAIAQTAGTGVIIAPGCVLPLDVHEENLEAVVSTAKSTR
jgi:uroporphyrinogen decarboxylase